MTQTTNMTRQIKNLEAGFTRASMNGEFDIGTKKPIYCLTISSCRFADKKVMKVGENMEAVMYLD